MNIQKYPGINEKIKNIHRADLPYFWLLKEAGYKEKNQIIFFGGASKDFDSSVDMPAYIKMTNRCLDYVRQHFGNYELYYKPHPADPDEQKLLDLRLFKVINEKNNAEMFLLKNTVRIKCAFAVNSWAAASAYGFGISSYLFLPLFKNIFGEKVFAAIFDCFPGMPESFFIDNLERPLIENAVDFQKDEIFEENFRRILNEKSGKIWFVIAITDYVAIIMSLAKMIKLIDPARPLNLIIFKHHRWDSVDLGELKPHFKEILIFPRLFYSLRPSRLIKAIKMARAIKNLKIGAEDIIVGASHFELAENCLISYHKSAKKIALLTEKEFHLFYETEHYGDVNFRQNKAGLFYNKILEPLLGLHRTLFFSQAGGDIFNLTRYQRPLNELYEEVYILGAPRTNENLLNRNVALLQRVK